MCVLNRPNVYQLPDVVIANLAFDGEPIILRIPTVFAGQVFNRDFVVRIPRLSGAAEPRTAEAAAPSMVEILPELNVATTAFEGGFLIVRVPTVADDGVVNRDFDVYIPPLELPVWAATEVEITPLDGVTAADVDSPYPTEYGGGD